MSLRMWSKLEEDLATAARGGLAVRNNTESSRGRGDQTADMQPNMSPYRPVPMQARMKEWLAAAYVLACAVVQTNIKVWADLHQK